MRPPPRSAGTPTARFHHGPWQLCAYLIFTSAPFLPMI
jgi:hypothetical protein